MPYKYIEDRKKQNKIYKKTHRKYINESARRVYKIKIINNHHYRISKNIRTRLYVALKNNYIKSDIHNLGCDLKYFKTYIESKFEKGMSWQNYGSKWHIDHIKPLSSFDLTNKKQLLECCNYKNIQPLWAKENILKGTKIL